MNIKEYRKQYYQKNKESFNKISKINWEIKKNIKIIQKSEKLGKHYFQGINVCLNCKKKKCNNCLETMKINDVNKLDNHYKAGGSR